MSQSDDAVRDCIAATSAQLPGCTLSPAAFLALHPGADELRDDLRGDLFLTTACVRGDRVALAEFFRRFAPMVRAVGRRSLPPNDVDDFVQEVFSRLLVAQGGVPARASHFEGSGSLLIFVRITASRCAIDRLRSQSARPDPTAEVDGTPVAKTPERLLANDQERAALRKVLAEVMADLALHERRVLRMRYLLGFSLARTASALQLHQTSVSRLVGRVTATISRRTLDQLGRSEGTLALDQLDFGSSIGAWLASRPPVS